MSVKENKAIAKRWIETVNSRGFEAFDKVLAKNFVHYNPSDSPWSPDFQGVEQVRKHFEEWTAEHPTFLVSVDDIIGEGDTVAARLTHSLEGKPVRHAIVFYKFSDGKIVDNWACSTQIQD